MVSKSWHCDDNVTGDEKEPGAILGSQQDSCVALEMPIWSYVRSTGNHHQHPHNNQQHWPNQVFNIILNNHPDTWLSRSLGESLVPRERSRAVAPSWTSQSKNIAIITICWILQHRDHINIIKSHIITTLLNHAATWRAVRPFSSFNSGFNSARSSKEQTWSLSWWW